MKFTPPIPEDGGSKFLRNVGILHKTTRHHNPEDLDLKTWYKF